MEFFSTNHQAAAVGFQDALLRGQAPDKGLYMPRTLPTFSREQLRAWAQAPYAEIAASVMQPFMTEDVDEDTLSALCAEAYDFEIPLEKVTPQRVVMRLDQGPTASFKDFAARAMARLMSYFLAQRQEQRIILTATSGDTGSAIAHAFHGVPRTQVLVLFPRDEVSLRQRKQMTTLGGNIRTVAIDGKFDDCQALVKRAFADPGLADMPLSSANSINIGRLLPQSVYYIYAYTRLRPQADAPITFVVPCGNFGNVMGAIFAARMGVPVDRFVLAVNANDEVPRFLDLGHYEKVVPSKNCLSNAMNVGHPSNLARLVSLFGGEMDEVGTIRKMPDLDAMRNALFSFSVSDALTRQTILDVYQEHKCLLEPHGAVGWAGANAYVKAHPEAAHDTLVIAETAHPAKFPEPIRALLGFDPALPPSLQSLEHKAEDYAEMDASYDAFVAFLQQHYTADAS